MRQVSGVLVTFCFLIWVLVIISVSISNYYKLDCFTQQKCILSPFWKPEVRNQGVGRASLPLEALRDNPLLAFSSYCSLWLLLPLLCLSLHVAFHMSVSSLPSLIRTPAI